MEPLISVIIPAFNAENTIEDCIKSIQEQTYVNLQIIAVNDGSTDNTGYILKKLSLEDSRIEVISIPNGGVSHARNIGIDNAKGDYITFVDADDTIKNNMYEHLLKLIFDYNAQIAHCSYSNYDSSGFVSNVGNMGRIIRQNKEEAISCLISGKCFAGGMWNKLYSIDLFRNVRLDESIKINEDILANYMLFNNSEVLVYSDLCLYNYYNYISSSTSTTHTLRKLKESLYVAKIIYEDSIGKNYENDALHRLAYINLLLYRYLIFNKNNNDYSIVEKSLLRKKIKSYLKNGCYVTKRNKISAFLSLYFPFLFRIVYFVYNKVRIEKYDPEQ